MEKKESYRLNLPHFQQPGQTYFVTWDQQSAVPPKAFARYTQELEMLKSQITFLEQQKSNSSEIEKVKQDYISWLRHGGTERLSDGEKVEQE